VWLARSGKRSVRETSPLRYCKCINLDAWICQECADGRPRKRGLTSPSLHHSTSLLLRPDTPMHLPELVSGTPRLHLPYLP
jgi:hypothetical protein